MTPDEMQAEIDQLRRQIAIFVDMAATWVKVGHENERLQDAIDRVRALHERETRTSRFGSIVWHLCPRCRDDGGDPLEHPCPTLRALDGEDA
jgi:hypothetical protein